MFSFSRDRLLFLNLILIVVTATLFWPVRHFDFVNIDDNILVYQNKYLNPVTSQNIVHLWKAPHEGLYMPLTYTAWAALATAASVTPQVGTAPPSTLTSTLDPGVFHSFNLLLHVVNALLVFALLRLLCKSDFAAAVGALLFAVHPVQVESVAWISELKGLLAATWGLLALWCYVKSITKTMLESDASGGQTIPVRGFPVYAVLAFFSFGLALLSKPSAVCLPFIACALDYFMLRHSARVAIRSLLPWLALAVVFMAFAHAAQPVDNPDEPLWTRPLIALDALAFYMGKIVWPFFLRPEYNRSPKVVLANGWAYWTWIFPFALGLAIWWRRKPALAAGALVGVLAVAPVLGFVPFAYQFFSTVADRYLYLALLGPAIVLASLLAIYPRRRYYALSVLCLLGLACVTMGQVRHWRNGMALYSYTLNIAPNSPISMINIGALLEVRGEKKQAEEIYRRAIRLQPHAAEAYLNLGILLANKKEYPEAIDILVKAIELSPTAYTAYGNLGIAYKRIKQYKYARLAYRRLVELEPDDIKAHFSLAEIALVQHQLGEAKEELETARLLSINESIFHATAAVMMDRFHYPQEAIPHYIALLRLSPNDPILHNDLGSALLRSGQLGTAIKAFNNAIKIKPQYAEAYFNLGLALRQSGREQQAAVEFRRARQLKPSFVVPPLKRVPQVKTKSH